MDAFHERLARVGLAALADYGFALAGGYAVQSIDVDAALTSGAYRHDELLLLARDHDPGFEPRLLARSLRAIERLPTAEFVAYGVRPAAVIALVQRMLEWATRIETTDQTRGPSGDGMEA